MYTVLFKDKQTRKTIRKTCGWITQESAQWSANTKHENEYTTITEHGKKVKT